MRFILILMLTVYSTVSIAKIDGCNRSPIPLFSDPIENGALSHIPVQTVARIASPRKNTKNNPYFPYYAHGSGVLIRYQNKNGYILSAFHLTYRHELIIVLLNDKYNTRRMFWAELVKDQPKHDLALYKIIDGEHINLHADIATHQEHHYGQDAFITGYPVSPKSVFKAELFPNSHLIVRKETLLGQKEFNGFKLNIKPEIVSDCIENGLSGGPVFNAQGHVLGLNQSTDRFSDNPDGSFNGYIIPAAIIRQFLEQ